MSCSTSAPVIAALAGLPLHLQPIDELGAEDVDLAVEDAAAIGHLALLVSELSDQRLELLIAHRADVRKRFVVIGGHSSSNSPVSV